MSKTQVNFRLEESLIIALKNRANTEGIGLTDLVTYLLKQGLESNLQISTIAQSLNQKEIEDAVYQRISQRIANEIEGLENRISQRIANSIVLDEKENSEKIDNLDLQNNKKSLEEQHISDNYTQDIQIENTTEIINENQVTPEKISKNSTEENRKFTNLSSSEVANIIKIQNSQMTAYNNKVKAEAKTKKYRIYANEKFLEPIKIELTKKHRTIKGEQYYLIATGFNNKTAPIWSLIRDDESPINTKLNIDE